jgi:hypothetical protein
MTDVTEIRETLRLVDAGIIPARDPVARLPKGMTLAEAREIGRVAERSEIPNRCPKGHAWDAKRQIVYASEHVLIGFTGGITKCPECGEEAVALPEWVLGGTVRGAATAYRSHSAWQSTSFAELLATCQRLMRAYAQEAQRFFAQYATPTFDRASRNDEIAAPGQGLAEAERQRINDQVRAQGDIHRCRAELLAIEGTETSLGTAVCRADFRLIGVDDGLLDCRSVSITLDQYRTITRTAGYMDGIFECSIVDGKLIWPLVDQGPNRNRPAGAEHAYIICAIQSGVPFTPARPETIMVRWPLVDQGPTDE